MVNLFTLPMFLEYIFVLPSERYDKAIKL
jgi:hypothetical protein